MYTDLYYSSVDVKNLELTESNDTHGYDRCHVT